MMYLSYFLGVLLYLLLLWSKLSQAFIFPTWMNSYLSDLLCIPLVLSTCLFIIRRLKNQRRLQLTSAMILVVVLLFSIVFEYYLPQKSTVYTRDPMDVVMYFLGGMIYYFIQLPRHFKQKK